MRHVVLIIVLLGLPVIVVRQVHGQHFQTSALDAFRFSITNKDRPDSLVYASGDVQVANFPELGLPWDGQKYNGTIVWTGGPHAYNMASTDEMGLWQFPSGYGSGLDFAGGSFEVINMADGVVADVDTGCTYPGFGCVVAIRHADKTVMLYAHLQKESIPTTLSEGVTVRRGDPIGIAGNSGMADGPIHLHIELRDGSDTCSATHTVKNKSGYEIAARNFCIKDGDGEIVFGNPLGWDELTPFVDGYHIGGYIGDSEGIFSHNYDGSAVKGSVKVEETFKYLDYSLDGKEIITRTSVFGRVHLGFTCNSNDCEHSSDPYASTGTQFAGNGVFIEGLAAAANAYDASMLDAFNAPRLLSTNSSTANVAVPDTTAPSATGFSASIVQNLVSLSVSGVADNSGGSGVLQVKYSAKWPGHDWSDIGSSSSYPYSLTWDTCAHGVPSAADTDIELGMEVWDRASNKWVWSQHFTNPHVKKNHVCTDASTPPSNRTSWNLTGWMNRFLAGYTNWEGWMTWESYPYIWADWGTGAPFDNFPTDEWSLRFWRDVYFEGGDYQFGIRSDDGGRIMLDSESSTNPTMNCWYDSCDDSRVRYVSPGWHRVTVEYFERGGDARLFAYWYGPGYPRPDQYFPTGRIASPAEGSVSNASILNVVAEASDDASGVNRADFYANYQIDGVRDWHYLGSDYSAPYAVSWDRSALADQQAWLQVDIVDNVGNLTSAAGGLVGVFVDKTSPDLLFDEPADGERHGSSLISLRSLAIDGIGLVGAQHFAGYENGTGEYWHEIGWDRENSDMVYGIDWDSSLVPAETPLSFFVYVYDRAGNYTGAAIWNNEVVPANKRVSVVGVKTWNRDKQIETSFPSQSTGYFVAEVDNLTNTDASILLRFAVISPGSIREDLGEGTITLGPGKWDVSVPFTSHARNGVYALEIQGEYQETVSSSVSTFSIYGAPTATPTPIPTATPSPVPTATATPRPIATSTPMSQDPDGKARLYLPAVISSKLPLQVISGESTKQSAQPSIQISVPALVAEMETPSPRPEVPNIPSKEQGIQLQVTPLVKVSSRTNGQPSLAPTATPEYHIESSSPE